MLYFYCCEATDTGGRHKKVDGFANLNGRIKKEKQLGEVQETIRQKVRQEFQRAEPYMNWENAKVVFLAFNPL